MCMHTTAPSSSQAAQKGSQCSECRLGMPMGTGFSVKLTARQPFLARRWTSSAMRCGSQTGSSPRGMKRSGYWPHQSSMCQSL